MGKFYKMSRQIQIRRGTAAEHANFTGAVGEITLDTTNKTLRVHDGETPGGITLARTDELVVSSPIPDTADYVIETQLPTAENNYTWYRKYESGWVEQGGIINNLTGNVILITLPIVMADTNYTVHLSDYIASSNPTQRSFVRDAPTVSTINIKSSTSNNINRTFWCVSGYAG